MIIAIEGPDGVGKTTLLNGLRPLFHYARFIQFQDVPPVFHQHIVQMEPVVFRLFEQMYEPDTIYICDRFFSVSSRVYALFHDRVYNLPDEWVTPELHIIRLRCDVETLIKRRPKECDLHRLSALYDDVCGKLACATLHTIDSNAGTGAMLQRSAELIRHMINNVYGLKYLRFNGIESPAATP